MKTVKMQKRGVLNLKHWIPHKDIRKLIRKTLTVHYDQQLISTAHGIENERSFVGKHAFRMHCAAHGYLSLLKWSHFYTRGANEWTGWGYPYTYGGSDSWSNHLCSCAASHGQLEVLKWLKVAFDGPLLSWDSTLVCEEAARYGYLEILKWARSLDSNLEHEDPYERRNTRSAPWNEWTCGAAAAGGHLEILQWLRQNGCPWNVSTCTHAAENGHLAVLEWAWDHGAPVDTWRCSEAASVRGQLDVLKWLHQRDYDAEWTPDHHMFTHLAYMGDIDILKWLHDEQGHKWENWQSVYDNAKGGGHAKVLNWLLLHEPQK